MLLFFRILGISIVTIICIFIILYLLFIFSEIKIIINQIKFIYFFGKKEIKYDCKIGLYLCGKIKWLSLKISNIEKKNKTTKQHNISSILEKNIVKKQIKKIKNNNKKKTSAQKKKSFQTIRKMIKKVNIDNMNLQLKIDTENAILTSYSVGIISTIIPNLVRKQIQSFNKNDYKFNIIPLYKNQNYIYFKLESIFSLKVVHIINMLKI